MNNSLFEIGQKSDMDMLDFLIQQKEPENLIETTYHFTALMIATIYNNRHSVLYLLEKSADVNTRNDFHLSALDYACENGYHEIAALLIRYGAHIHERDGLNWTPLLHASLTGNVKTVELLLKKMRISTLSIPYPDITLFYVPAKKKT